MNDFGQIMQAKGGVEDQPVVFAFAPAHLGLDIGQRLAFDPISLGNRQPVPAFRSSPLAGKYYATRHGIFQPSPESRTGNSAANRNSRFGKRLDRRISCSTSTGVRNRKPASPRSLPDQYDRMTFTRLHFEGQFGIFGFRGHGGGTAVR